MHVTLENMIRRHKVEFAGFLVEATYPHIVFLVVVAHAHSGGRSDTGNRVEHKSNERPVAQTDERACVDGIKKRAHLLWGEGSV